MVMIGTFSFVCLAFMRGFERLAMGKKGIWFMSYLGFHVHYSEIVIKSFVFVKCSSENDSD